MISLALLLVATQSVTEPVARAEYLQVMDGEFKSMDADGNGWVTAAEVSAKLTQEQRTQAMAQNRQVFVQLDTNRDGMLSHEEFAGLVSVPQQASPADYMQRIDLNRDGQVTLVEHRTVMLSAFDNLDADKDGVVTPMEAQAGAAQPQQAQAPQGR